MESSAGPTIFKSTSAPLPSSQTVKNSSNWFKRNIVRILLVVLAVGVLGEIVYGGLTLFSPATVRNLNIMQPDLNEIGGAKFSLIPERASYKKGETVVIEAKLFTGGYTVDSGDLVVKYDPAVLKPAGENFVAVGQIFAEYPPVQVDNQQGLIGISGITIGDGAGFSGVGTFAKMSFTALKDGSAEVTVDFQPNTTADSNIVLSGSMQDVISGADNASVTISETEVQGNSPAQKCESFTQSCQDNAGKVGTQICKAGTINKFAASAVINGACGYDARQTVSCEVCSVN